MERHESERGFIFLPLAFHLSPADAGDPDDIEDPEDDGGPGADDDAGHEISPIPLRTAGHTAYMDGVGNGHFRRSDDITISAACEGKRGSLLMFRDSFGNILHEFMADSFAESLFSRSNNYRLDLIGAQQADYVVIELVERNLNYLCRYAPVFPAPRRELDEIPMEGGISGKVQAEEQSELPGHVKFCGQLDVKNVDADSTIYVMINGTVYEASPAGTGGPGAIPFTLCVPGSGRGGDPIILVRSGGELKRAMQEQEGAA